MTEAGHCEGNFGRDGAGQVAFSNSAMENVWEGGRMFVTWQDAAEVSGK